MNLQAAFAIEISLRLVAFSVALGALEGLWLWSRGHFGAHGLWSWQIIGEGWPSRLATVAAPLMAQRGMFGVLTLRLLCATIVVFTPYAHPLFAAGLTVLVVLHLLMTVRMPWGGEGSDQMTLVVLLPGMLARLLPYNSVAVTSAALFIGAEITLSYFASGMAKVRSAEWRSGRALPNIMNHHTYGHPGFGQLLRAYPAPAKVLNALVMAFQVSFFLFFFIPMPFALIYIAGGVMFHACIAYFMRLNQFFVVFVGTYPCLIFAHEYVRQFIPG